MSALIAISDLNDHGVIAFNAIFFLLTSFASLLLSNAYVRLKTNTTILSLACSLYRRSAEQRLFGKRYCAYKVQNVNWHLAVTKLRHLATQLFGWTDSVFLGNWPTGSL
jgi:hypothetical protein